MNELLKISKKITDEYFDEDNGGLFPIKKYMELLRDAANRHEAEVIKGDSQPMQTAGQWVLEVDNENEQYKILTKEKVLPVNGEPNQEQQWIASVYCINDAAEIIINHNEKVGGLSC